MSLEPNNDASHSRAEKAFRDAFSRLKEGKPIRLAQGVRVSQNNVAKEAGCDPSALKKARYPLLVREIQSWLRDSPHPRETSIRQKMIGQRNKNQHLQNRVAALILERDKCASLLVEADATILELVRRVARLESMIPSNVIELTAENGTRKPRGIKGLSRDANDRGKGEGGGY